jgi:pyruvate/2-oxoglutarate/acetoin dehydrogenase E1 component
MEEANKTAGVSAEISAMIVEDEDTFGYLDAPIKRLTAPDVPVPFSPSLENFYLPSEETIIQTVKEVTV